MTRRLVLLLSLAALAGCGDDDTTADSGSDSGSDTGVDAGPIWDDSEDDEGFVTLVAGDWELGPGEEAYYCVQQTIPREVHIAEFKAIAPAGTHHTVLTMAPPFSGPDGSTRCDANALGPTMIYGSGVGTTPLVLPDGVAAKVEEGRQVLVNLHVFNTSREPLSGRSGVKVKLIDASEVTHEAQVVLMGTEDLAIPARSSDHVHEGACEIEVPGTLFAIMPHMHQLGTYMRVTLGDTVLHDAPFTFDEQRYGETFSQPVAGGERLNVRCTYDNPTDAPVGYGDSSLEEMCYALVYRFPPSDPFDVVCADD